MSCSRIARILALSLLAMKLAPGCAGKAADQASGGPADGGSQGQTGIDQAGGGSAGRDATRPSEASGNGQGSGPEGGTDPLKPNAGAGDPTAAKDAAPTSSTDASEVARKGLVALYTFDDIEGDVIKDTSGYQEPLNLRRLPGDGSIEWIEGGVEMKGTDKKFIILSTDAAGKAEPATKVVKAIKETSAYTIELWANSTVEGQDGPARIFSLAKANHYRDVTILQGGAMGNRTCGDDFNGKRLMIRVLQKNDPQINGCDGFKGPLVDVPMQKAHIVFTQDAQGQQKLHIDAKVVSSSMLAQEDHDLAYWREDVALALGNEPSVDFSSGKTGIDSGHQREWQGRIYLLAIYNRALSEEEVRGLFEQGDR